MRIRETILTVACVGMFSLGTLGEIALAQGGRGSQIDALQQRIDALQSSHDKLDSVTQVHDAVFAEQLAQFAKQLQRIEDSQTWTSRSLILAVGGLIAQRLWALITAPKPDAKESDK